MTSAETPEPDSGVVRRAGRWLFVNRRTGRVTVAQWPNTSLTIFIAVSVGLRVLRPSGGTERALRVAADVAIVVWAVDEVIRGVNPFRRALGLAVIGVTVASMIL
jgi:hypothetical protein